MKRITFVTESAEETQKIGGEFARSHLRQGATLTTRIVALYGDLGSGKTTFVQGLAKGLGIKKRIISLTFIFVRCYEVKSQKSLPANALHRQVQAGKVKTTIQNSKLFYHVDLYRLENDDQIEGLGITEILSDPQNIVAIEWAEKMGRLLPEKRWDVRFEYMGENKRRITITKLSS